MADAMPGVPKTRRSGFTLAEAVLAMALLGIGVVVLIECTARCLAVIRTARSYQEARATLDRGQADYPLVWTNAASLNEVAPVAYPNGYSFSRELQAVDGEESLYLVTTRVVWSESGRESCEELEGYLYSPPRD